MNDRQLNWMIDQIKIEANAIRNQISGLPAETQSKIRKDVIEIICMDRKETKHEH